MATIFLSALARLHSAVGATSDCRYRVHLFESQLSHITFMENDHEIISTVIPILLLIQEEQLSATMKEYAKSTL